MMEITAEIRALIDKAAAGMELAGDEYIDPADGLIHCKKCGGQRQDCCCHALGNRATSCPAVSASVSGSRGTAQGRRGTASAAWSVSSAGKPRACKTAICTTTPCRRQRPKSPDGPRPAPMWRTEGGLQGTTTACCCLGMWNRQVLFRRLYRQRLLDRDVPVLMTNFPTILNRLTGMFSEDRADFIASFDEYDLLIIDDLGVERSTEYAMEADVFRH